MISKATFIFTALLGMDLTFGGALARALPNFRVNFLNVGQGDSILIETAEQNHILVDGGAGDTVLAEIGNELPYFFDEIDLMVLTHPHDDHLQGLIPILERFKVGAVLMSAPRYESPAYEAFLEEVNELNTCGIFARAKIKKQKNCSGKLQVYFAESGTDFRLGDTEIEVLYPFAQVTGQEFLDVNDSSIVMKISERGHSVLLTGDAGIGAEEACARAQSCGGALSADILKVGHHGSKYSTSAELLQSVRPAVVAISVGENSYGHPSPEMLTRAQEAGAEILRTDLDGRVSIRFNDCARAQNMGGKFYSLIRSIFAPRERSFESSCS
ncbi:MAG: MBL fold metallo-hydrolase [Candidatus Gracilibacteria bacterium]|jgi:competence protein ComEC